VFALIIGTLIRLVPNTITLHPLSTKLSIIVLAASFSCSWMDFSDTTRSISYQMINIKQPLSALERRFLIKNYHLALKTLELLFSGSCRTHSTISNILLNLTSMNYLLTRLIDKTIFVTYDPYFFDVIFTIHV
jgi:hypothetical protein